jgi:hypothetical protein
MHAFICNSNRRNSYNLWRLQNSYFHRSRNFYSVSCAGNPAGSDTVDYLVVAGGGGGSYYGAGGGAGGLRFYLNTTNSPSQTSPFSYKQF